MARIVELASFVGDWSDSLGNNVQVVQDSRGAQVTLAKANGSGREIVLTVKKVGNAFQCGHYALDENESSYQKIVWRDKRFADRLTIWQRQNVKTDDTLPAVPPPPRGPLMGLGGGTLGAPLLPGLGTAAWPQPGFLGQVVPPRLGHLAMPPPPRPQVPLRVPPPPPAPAEKEEEMDWSHVLGVLAAARDEPEAPPVPEEEARWTEVLNLLNAASGEGGEVKESALFGVFGLPQSSQPLSAVPSEAEREAVLNETLARLLREKGGTHTDTMPFGSAPFPSASFDPESEGAGRIHVSLPGVKVEGPLDKFIRVFGLDQLAAECLRKLEDDEAAYVIESCQGRLKHAKNPSAVVMIAIKGVAARVGRRYYGGSKEVSALQAQIAAARGGDKPKGDGGLEMFMGSPEPSPSPGEEEEVAADVDPYGGGFDLEDDDEVVDIPEPPRKRQNVAPVAVVAAADADGENGEDEEEDDSLFFVDTGGL